MSPLHQNQPILSSGAILSEARAAMILLHGRGSSAEDILTLADHFPAPALAFFAPQAANHTWYPNRFLMPVASNEPWLSSALQVVGDLLNSLAVAGIPSERTFLLGFSQGACLALEYAARHPQRYAGVIALSGAMIENGDEPRQYTGSLGETPVFLGCSDVDFHVPLERVQRSADLMRGLNGAVTLRIYPSMGHTVNEDEVEFVRTLIHTTLETA